MSAGKYSVLQIFVSGDPEDLRVLSRKRRFAFLAKAIKKEQIANDTLVYTYVAKDEEEHILYIDRMQGYAVSFPNLSFEAHHINHIMGKASLVEKYVMRSFYRRRERTVY